MDFTSLKLLMDGVVSAETLRVALKIGIFDALARKPAPLSSLSKELSITSEKLLGLLNFLESIELIKRNSEFYGNTAITNEYLVKSSNRYFGGYLEYISEEIYPNLLKSYTGKLAVRNHLASVVRDQKVRPVKKQSRRQLELHSGFLSFFSFKAGEHLASTYDFSNARHLVDIAGNDGSLLIPILMRYPRLSATVVDLPELKPLAKKKAAHYHLTNRLFFSSQNVFKNLKLPIADFYLCGSFLHDWVDEVALIILMKIKKAMSEKSEFILHEHAEPDEIDVKKIGFGELFLRMQGLEGHRKLSKLKQMLKLAQFKPYKEIAAMDRVFIFSKQVTDKA